MRILLGSPDKDSAGIRRLLAAKGRILDLAEPFSELASIALHSGPYDAVLLSVADARRQAVPALREMRARGVKLPVVVLAASLTTEEEGALLELGADDVLARPIVPGVVVARLRTRLRRSFGHASPVLACANVELDQARRTVRVDGRPVAISHREFDLLETLMLRRGTLLPKATLMSLLYGDEDGPDSRIVDVFVCKLRRKLAVAGAPDILRTVWGRGYVAEDPGPAAIAAAQAKHEEMANRARKGLRALVPEPADA